MRIFFIFPVMIVLLSCLSTAACNTALVTRAGQEQMGKDLELYLKDDFISIKKPAFRSVRFTDYQHGWIAGYRGVFFTKDGGNTWKKQPIVIGSPSLYTATAAVRDTGLIAWASKDLAIIRSDTGIVIGKANSTEWEKIDIKPQILEQFNSISFTDQQQGWGAGLNSVYKTSDGGRTWESAKSGTMLIAKSIYAFSPAQAWIAGGLTRLSYTADGGQSFRGQKLASPTTADLLYITFFDSTHGWACGTDGLIIQTLDGGNQWDRQVTSSPKGSSYSSLSFVTLEEGWAVGSSHTNYDLNRNSPDESIILYTSNGGSKWSSLKNDIKDSLLSVQALPNGKAWAVGMAGTVTKISYKGSLSESVILN